MVYQWVFTLVFIPNLLMNYCNFDQNTCYLSNIEGVASEMNM